MKVKTFIEEEKIYHHFQPIFNIKTGNIHGFEGLLRASDFPNPEEAFIAAKRENQLYELDSKSIHKAILRYQSAGFTRKNGYLFLNVFPSTLNNPAFTSFVKEIVNTGLLENQQIIFEISELEKITNIEEIRSIISYLKILGFLIAIDDMGKGYSEFQTLVELEPDYIKLDRYFSFDLNNCNKKQTIIESFLTYCEQYNSKLILEGLEYEQDLEIARSIGIEFAQGYLLGRPSLLNIKNNIAKTF